MPEFDSVKAQMTADELEMGELSEAKLAEISDAVSEVEAPTEKVTCKEMRALLERDIPKRLISPLKQRGQVLKYLHWVVVTKLLAHYAPKYTGRVTNVLSDEYGVTVTYEIVIPCSDGTLIASNVGYKAHKYDNGKPMGFGGASLAAQRQAMKRAAADLGIGRGFYEGEG